MRVYHALVAITVAASRLDAQAVATPSPRAHVGEQAVDETQEMKSALRKLVMKQEAHWADHGSYTTDMSQLGFYSKAGGSSVPTVQVIFAGSRGWTGLATHRGMKGKSCVIFIGSSDELPKLPTTLGAKLPASEEAVPVCDVK